jgi:hypothetical protein
LFTIAAGCDALFGSQDDPDHCPDHPHRSCLDPAGPIPCDSDRECPDRVPICDLSGTRTCVQCTPEGRCAAPAEVAYVQAGGTGAPACTQATPCGTLQDALTAVTEVRRYVKLGPGKLADAAATTIIGQAVTILADPTARLDRAVDGTILEVRGNGTDVRIYDLEIGDASGGSGSSGIAVGGGAGTWPKLTLTRVRVVNNTGGGIEIASGSVAISQSTIFGNAGGGILATGGAVAVSQSTITGNLGGGIIAMKSALVVARSTISFNHDGGISFTGPGATFDITNSFIVRNGDETQSLFGGLKLDFAAPAGNRLELNTIADNKAAASSAGVICRIPEFAAPNNLVARNLLATSTTTAEAQVSAHGCRFPTSKIQSDLTGLLLEHPDPPGVLSYKLLRGSGAVDQATTSSDLVVDYDGEPRPSGAAPDIGADELQP